MRPFPRGYNDCVQTDTIQYKGIVFTEYYVAKQPGSHQLGTKEQPGANHQLSRRS